MNARMHTSVLISAALFCGVIVLNWDAAATSVQFWDTSHNYQHGAMMVLVLLAILFLTVVRFKPTIHVINWAAYGLTFVVGCLLVLSTIAQVLVLQISLLMAMIWLIGLSLFGWEFAKKTLYPFVLVMFCVPVWDFLVEPLQQTTIHVVNYLLGVLRRTSYVEGDLIMLRHGQFLVEHGCSGMNFFITGLMLSGLYAHWYANGWFAKAAVIVSGAVASLIANWARVFIIVMAGDLTAMRHPLVESHTTFGWIVFGIVTALMMVLGYFLLPEVDKAAEPANRTEAVAARTFQSEPLNWGGLFVTASALLLPGLLFFALRTGYGDPADVDIQMQAAAPAVSIPVSERQGVGIEIAFFPDATTHRTEYFAFGGQTIQVDVYANDLRDRERELVGFPNRWFDPAIWQTLDVTPLQDDLAIGYPPPDLVTLSSASDKIVIVTAYLFGDTLTESKVVAKILGTLAYLTKQFPAGAFLISTPCAEDCETAKRSLEQFVAVTLGSEAIQLSLIEPVTTLTRRASE